MSSINISKQLQTDRFQHIDGELHQQNTVNHTVSLVIDYDYLTPYEEDQEEDCYYSLEKICCISSMIEWLNNFIKKHPLTTFNLIYISLVLLFLYLFVYLFIKYN